MIVDVIITMNKAEEPIKLKDSGGLRSIIQEASTSPMPAATAASGSPTSSISHATSNANNTPLLHSSVSGTQSAPIIMAGSIDTMAYLSPEGSPGSWMRKYFERDQQGPDDGLS